MAVKLGEGKVVSNWCLADELFKWLPSGTYYLILVTPWDGPREMPTLNLSCQRVGKRTNLGYAD